MKKKLALLFCMLSCILMLAGCSLVKENENFDKKSLETQTDEYVASWFTLNYQEFIDMVENMDEASMNEFLTMNQITEDDLEVILAQYREFAEIKEKYVNVTEKVATTFTITQESATVNETWKCENGKKLVISLTFDETGMIQVDENGMRVVKFEEYKTMAQKMQKAGLNTIMCMAIVFAVLIFISLLIMCFKFFTIFEKKTTSSTPVPAVAETAPVAEENLADDLELVAVITAAIAAASETESADGLVVRSIIRRS